MIFLQFSQNKEERYHLSSWACSRNNVLSFLGNVRMCVSKGSNLFCVKKAKSVLVWGKPSFFYKRKSLEITVVKEGDRGELRKSKKGSVQSFLAASVSEASELSLSQIHFVLYENILCSIFSCKVSLASHVLLLPLTTAWSARQVLCRLFLHVEEGIL